MISRILLVLFLISGLQPQGEAGTQKTLALSSTAINDSFPENAKLLLLEENGLKGLRDDDGNVLIPARYEDIGWTNREIKLVDGVIGYSENGLWGLMDAKGNRIVSPKYLTVEPLNGVIKASLRGKVTGGAFYGVISARDKVLIPFRFARLQPEGDRLIAVKKSGDKYSYGLISYENELLIPFHFFQIRAFGNRGFVVTDYRDKMAIFDRNGNALTPFNIDSLGALNGNYAPFFTNAQAGLLRADGSVILDARYKKIRLKEDIKYLEFPEWKIIRQGKTTNESILADSIQPFAEEALIVAVNGNAFIRKGTSKWSNVFDQIVPHSSNAFRVARNGKFGLVDSTGQQIIPMLFDSLYLDQEFAYAWTQGGSQQGWQIFDIYGTERTKRIYDAVRPYYGGLFPVMRNNKWGFMNRQGKEVIYCVYDQFDFYARDLIKVRFHSEEGIIDNRGEWVVYPEAGELEIIGREHYLVRAPFQSRFYSMKKGLIYFTGNPIRSVDGYLLEKVDSARYWQIDYQGVRIQESGIESINPIYKDSVYVVNDRGRVGLRVRGNGDIFFDPSYNQLYPPSEGYMKVRVDDKYGFVNYDGVLRIAHRYDDAHDFQEGLAAIRILGKWGFISKSEKIVIQPTFDWVGDFSDGLAMVSRNGKYGLIDKEGNLLEDIRFSSIRKLPTGRFLVKEEDEYGLMDRSGEILVSPKYEQIIDPGNGELIVKRRGRYGITSLTGVGLVPPIYDQIVHDPYSERYFATQFSGWKEL